MKSLLNQRIRVMERLIEVGKISRNYAIDTMWITRLSSIIHTLRTKYGWEIDMEEVEGPKNTIYTLIKKGRWM